MSRNTYLTLIFLIVMVTAIYLLRPLYDPDFYWHLKTGEWIWNHRMLPDTDYFGVYPLPLPSARLSFILSSYWLMQIMMYGIYTLFGMTGFILYRLLIAFAFVLILRAAGAARSISALLLEGICVMLLLEFYFIERPQFISFLFFAVEISMILKYLSSKSCMTTKQLAAYLCILMIFWSNMHGGYLIGESILIFFIFSEGAKFISPALNPVTKERYIGLSVALMAALAASFLNPNAVNLIRYLPTIFDSGYYINATNLEMMTIVGYYTESHNPVIFLYMITMAFAASAFLYPQERINISIAGIIAGTIIMGCIHMRLLPYFLVSTMILLPNMLYNDDRLKKLILLPLALMFIATAVLSLKDEPYHALASIRNGWIPAHQFPVETVKFIKSNSLKGNIYSTMLWGGFLMWETGDDSKTFYDGRTLSVQRAWEYEKSRHISSGSRQYWQGLFNQYNIDMIILPIYEDNGTPSQLVNSVLGDKSWMPVFSNDLEVLFLRNREK